MNCAANVSANPDEGVTVPKVTVKPAVRLRAVHLPSLKLKLVVVPLLLTVKSATANIFRIAIRVHNPDGPIRGH